MKIKRIFTITVFFLLANVLFAQEENKTFQINDSKTALLIIDVQLFYFPGGSTELHEPLKASSNSQKVLQTFRKNKALVIHIKHNSKTQGEIHKDVKPVDGEFIIIKNEANSFNGTNLHDLLEEKGIEKIVICGMQTHMCVEAATRAAYDLGYKCTLISDACATRDLKYGEHVIKAKDVHNSTLSSLNNYYAKVLSTEEFLELIGEK